MPATAWPSGLCPAEIAWNRTIFVRSAGRNAQGFTQEVAAPGGLWRARLVVPLVQSGRGSSGDLWAVWRAFEATVGPGGVVILPRFEKFGREAATATLAANAARGAISIAVTWSGAAPYAGMDFGLGQRVHRIVSVSGSSPAYTFAVWPSLREARSNGTAVELAAPVCLMRFVPGTLPDPTMKAGAVERLDLQLVEHVELDQP